MKIAEYKQIGEHIEIQKSWIDPTYSESGKLLRDGYYEEFYQDMGYEKTSSKS